MAEQQSIEAQIGALGRYIEKRLGDIETILANVTAPMIKREELDERMKTYATMDRVVADENRIMKLEESPQRMVSWIALFASAGIGCLSLLIMFLGMLISLAVFVIPHLK